MRCDTPPGHLVNSVTVAWKHQHASSHSAPLVQACQDYQHFNFHTRDLHWCRWKCRCNILPQGYLFFGPEKYASVSSGMGDKLISCLGLLLLSMRAAKYFYNSINSTLAAQWVDSTITSTNCFWAAVVPNHVLMLRKHRSNNVTQWYVCVVHQRNKDDCVGLAQNHPTSRIPQSVLSHW